MDGGLSVSAFINGLGDGRSGQITGVLSTLWYIVQVICAVTVLVLDWGKPCDQKLGLWLAVATCRIIMRLLLSAAALKIARNTAAAIARAQERGETVGSVVGSEHATMIDKMKEVLDVFGLVWFTLGNAWVFGSRDCRATAPGIFYLSLSVIIVTYIVMLFPIILAILFIPFACFCLPCFLRLLVRFRENENRRGATRSQINSIPTVKYRENMFGEDNNMCSICLAEYTEGEKLRLLKCSGAHHFHVGCVDQWLQLNSICPCCRENIMGNNRNRGQRDGEEEMEGEDAVAAAAAAAHDTDLEAGGGVSLSAIEDGEGGREEVTGGQREWTVINLNEEDAAAAAAAVPEASFLPVAAASHNAAAGGGSFIRRTNSFEDHRRISLRALLMSLHLLGDGNRGNRGGRRRNSSRRVTRDRGLSNASTAYDGSDQLGSGDESTTQNSISLSQIAIHHHSPGSLSWFDGVDSTVDDEEEEEDEMDSIPGGLLEEMKEGVEETESVMSTTASLDQALRNMKAVSLSRKKEEEGSSSSSSSPALVVLGGGGGAAAGAGGGGAAAADIDVHMAAAGGDGGREMMEGIHGASIELPVSRR